MHEIMTPLDLLADEIKSALQRREKSREAWIAATLDLCKHLADARARFREDQEFNKWLVEHGLGNDVLNKDDRVAAISMGKHLEQAKIILEQTQRRSLRLIHETEFKPGRFRSAAKPAMAESVQEESARSEPVRPNRERDERVIALHDAGQTYNEISEATGLTVKAISKILTNESYRREGAAEAIQQAGLDAIPSVNLARTKQEQFDRALRVALRKQEAEFEIRIQAEVKKRLNETILPHYATRYEQYNQVVRARKGVMTRAEFRKLQSCLHPDRIADDALKPRFAEAFNILNSCELLLCSEKEMPTGSATLPRTVEELLARKKTKTG